MWSSKVKIFGMPLVSAGFFARGFFSIGFAGTGVITIAQFGTGVIFIGQFGIGLFTLAQFSAGFFSMGQFAAALCVAIGQGAIGFAVMALGGLGYYSVIRPASFMSGLETLFSKISADPLPFLAWTTSWLLIFLFFYMQKSKFTGNWKLRDFFRPKWKHSSLKYRIKNISKIGNLKILEEIVLNDPVTDAKIAAIANISDPATLRSFALDNSLSSIHSHSVRKIEDENVLLEIALNTDNHSIAGDIFSKKPLQTHLKKIAREAKNDEIRAKAILKTEPDENFLSERADRETNDSILMSIAEKTARQETLFDIIKKSANENVKTFAAKKLKKENIPVISRLLAEEVFLSSARSLASLIDDQDTLKYLSRTAAHPSGRIASVETLTSPGDDFLTDLVREENDIYVCKAAIMKIADTDQLKNLAMNYPKKSISVLAVGAITQRHVLWDIFRNATDPKVKEEARSRFEDLKPGYFGFKIEMKCPYCSQPVFVNGLFSSIKCGSCLSNIDLDVHFWKTVITSSTGITRQLTYNDLTVEKTASLPKCLKCGTELDVELYPAGKDSFVECPSCREHNPSFPLPEQFNWIQDANQLFCAEKQSDETKILGQTKPVSITCVKCGAPLTITVETPRNAVCGYCETVQYLPDVLWTSLHPARKKRQWFVSFTKS
ncbi:hypothetical protein JXL83_02245 [candidate division WOR-3 bacterium]|nr:hypothetical protein [candidate division WOR-3 bacterium]